MRWSWCCTKSLTSPLWKTAEISTSLKPDTQFISLLSACLLLHDCWLQLIISYISQSAFEHPQENMPEPDTLCVNRQMLKDSLCFKGSGCWIPSQLERAASWNFPKQATQQVRHLHAMLGLLSSLLWGGGSHVGLPFEQALLIVYTGLFHFKHTDAAFMSH